MGLAQLDQILTLSVGYRNNLSKEEYFLTTYIM